MKGKSIAFVVVSFINGILALLCFLLHFSLYNKSTGQDLRRHSNYGRNFEPDTPGIQERIDFEREQEAPEQEMQQLGTDPDDESEDVSPVPASKSGPNK